MAETAPAEQLRAAAKLMRERADAATPGPWTHMCLGSEGCQVLRASGTVRERGRGRVARFGQKDWHADHADAEFTAAMAPDLAKRIAYWLNEVATRYEDPDREDDPNWRDWNAALDIARQYLGIPHA